MRKPAAHKELEIAQIIDQIGHRDLGILGTSGFNLLGRMIGLIKEVTSPSSMNS